MQNTTPLVSAGLVAALATAVLATSCVATAPVAKPPASRIPLAATVPIDLPRYMGHWWVIAHTPYFAEKGKVAGADIYTLRPDGRIDNVYSYRKRFGGKEKQMHAVATVVPGTGNAQWTIAFFGGLLRADYLVLEVAPDYSWALIGQPSRKLAWVFAREPRMGDAELARLLERFRAFGYDPASLQRVPQFVDQQLSGKSTSAQSRVARVRP
ncbi:MAG: lipocalin family protein [Pseudoxanthomonas sp.]